MKIISCKIITEFQKNRYIVIQSKIRVGKRQIWCRAYRK